MTSYELEPEVAGGLGPATEWGSRPNEIARLDYQFDDWLGDDLVTTTPAVLATARVRDAILAAGLTGVDFAPVIVSRSELKVPGRPGNQCHVPTYWCSRPAGSSQP